jgi:hypothetical protein
LNGTTLLGQGSLPTVADLTWPIVGAADVDGDMHPDLTWRNAADGAVSRAAKGWAQRAVSMWQREEVQEMLWRIINPETAPYTIQVSCLDDAPRLLLSSCVSYPEGAMRTISARSRSGRSTVTPSGPRDRC